jgi:catechol-2,3-dioxygenase
MIKVQRVARVALGVRDLDKQTAFYVDTWGLGITEEADGKIYLRTTAPEHNAVTLGRADETGLQELGFEVASADDLERAATELADAGTAIVKAPGPADRPGAKRNMRLRDPDGNLVELFWGDEAVREDYGTRNVKPLNLNHVVLRTTDVDRAHAFYKGHFGFKESDWNGHQMVFLRCNEIHHQIAFTTRSKAGLDHVAFEVNDFFEIAKGVYYLGDKGVPRIWGPGRHGAGNNLFSYFWDPEQNIIEYTADIIRIKDDAAWTPRVWPGRDTVDLWKQGPPKVMKD